MITVMFFASVREAAGDGQIEVEAAGLATVSDLIASLGARNTNYREALARENLLIAVNQTMVDNRAAIGDGDEVAFFPPVTGG